MGITIYIRYRQILELYKYHPDIGDATLKYNNMSVWFGMLSCLGISIVANFQETNVRIVHYFGAFCCFGFGTLYFWIQVNNFKNVINLYWRKILWIFGFFFLFKALLSYMLQPFAGSKLKAHIRLGMAIVCTVLFIELAVTGAISHILFNGQDPRKW